MPSEKANVPDKITCLKNLVDDKDNKKSLEHFFVSNFF